MLDLESLAQVGEFLGGGAVLVSLVYLVISVRSNTRQLEENAKLRRLSEMRATYEQHDRYRQLIVSNREVAEIVANTLSGIAPDPVDAVRFDNFTLQLIYSVQHQWDCVQEGVMDADELERVLPKVAAVLAMPGGRAWWDENRTIFKAGYVAALEEHLRAAGSA